MTAGEDNDELPLFAEAPANRSAKPTGSAVSSSQEEGRNYGKYIVYVDESGDHGMQSIDEQYPVFVLAFCVFHKRHYSENVVPALEIFKFKHFGHDTEVMGASFRNKGEITELTGCDLLTISPGLLGELAASEEAITPKLNAANAKSLQIDRVSGDEKTFRWLFNEDAMATEKTAEGIRNFAKDIVKLETMVAAALG